MNISTVTIVDISTDDEIEVIDVIKHIVVEQTAAAAPSAHTETQQATDVSITSSKVNIEREKSFKNQNQSNDCETIDCGEETALEMNEIPKPKARTRRGIALISPQINFQETEDEVATQIYTKRINCFRVRAEKKKITFEDITHCTDFTKENYLQPENLTSPEKKSKNETYPDSESSSDTIEMVLSTEEEVPLSPPSPCKPRPIKPKRKCVRLLKKLDAAASKYRHTLLVERMCPSPSTDVDMLDDDVLIENSDKTFPLKIRWRSAITKIPIKKNQHFETIMQTLAADFGVSVKRLLLSFNDVIVKPSDTPAVLGVTISDFIDCGLVSVDSNGPIDNQEEDPHLLHLKLQAKDMRKKLVFTIRKTEPMSKLMEQFATQQAIPVEKVKLRFDGEDIEPDETPFDLELENGYCIDVVIHS